MKAFPFFLLLVLEGCFSMPKNSIELVRNAPAVQSYCYNVKNQVVEKRLKNFLDSCYSRKYVTVDTPYGTYTNKYDEKTEKKIIQGGIRYSLSNIAGYVLSVDILPEKDGCETKMKLYGVSFFWRKNFDNIDMAVKSGEIDCPL